MKNSGAGVLILIVVVIYIIKENWLIILVILLIIGLVWILVTWANTDSKQYKSQTHNNSTTNYSKIRPRQSIAKNEIARNNIDLEYDILSSFIKCILNTSASYHVIKSIRRIQNYQGKHIQLSKTATNSLFNFIIDCASQMITNIKESNRKNQTIAECKTVIFIISELKKGTSNEQICKSLYVDNTQLDQLNSLINHIIHASKDLSTLRALTRLQNCREEYLKYYEPNVALFDYIINHTKDALDNLRESSHKNRIMAECNAIIYLITELKNGVSFEQITKGCDKITLKKEKRKSVTAVLSQEKLAVETNKDYLNIAFLGEELDIVKVLSDNSTPKKIEKENPLITISDILTMLLDHNSTKSHALNADTINAPNTVDVDETCTYINTSTIVEELVKDSAEQKNSYNKKDSTILTNSLTIDSKEDESIIDITNISPYEIDYENNIIEKENPLITISDILTMLLDYNSTKSHVINADTINAPNTVDVDETCTYINTSTIVEELVKDSAEQKNSYNKKDSTILTNSLTIDSKEDESIIDITNISPYEIDYENNIIEKKRDDKEVETYKIPNYSEHPFMFKNRKDEFELTTVSSGVPFWKHTYIYDVSPLQYSNHKVKLFYNSFKKAFFDGVYYDLNVDLDSNFYFTLLFDLFDEYKEHADIVRLEKQLYTLSTCYPKVMTYAVDKLLKAIETNQENTLDITLLMDLYPHYRWKLGDKYAIKLGLSQKEKELFNRLISTTNKFSIIEKFQMEIVKLFLFVIREYEIERLEGEITILSEIVVKKYFTNGYTPPSETIERELWYCIYKSCENHIRTQYGIREKLQIYTSYYTKEPQIIIEDKLMSAIENVISSYHTNLSVTDKETEIELNKSNPTRWRDAYEQLVQDYNDLDSFFLGLQEIKAVNENNVNLKHMYYEAMKLVFKFDTILALKLYIEYVTLNLMDIGGKEKSIPQIISKKIFFNEIQKDKFEEILLIYKDDRNKSKAYLALEELFLTKRKKIKLNALEIEKITELHSDTVKLLNSVMEDDLEIVQVKQNAEQINKLLDIPLSPTILSNVEQKLLKMFEDCNLILEKDDVELYAKSQNLMANRLIEKINDRYYDVLDDVLIEDNGNEWTIYEDYYKIILTI